MGPLRSLPRSNVTVGSVIRHRAIEFRRFLDDIDANVAPQPGVPIVLDNASSPKDQAHPQLAWPAAALPSALCSDLGFLDQSGRALLRPTDREVNSSRCPPIGRVEQAINRFIEPHNQAPSLSDGSSPLTTSLPASKHFCEAAIQIPLLLLYKEHKHSPH